MTVNANEHDFYHNILSRKFSNETLDETMSQLRVISFLLI